MFSNTQTICYQIFTFFKYWSWLFTFGY
jgi:hypothetical protein